jgi:hypothetical protein
MRASVLVATAVTVLALKAALAPPTARDALFYHFALPKAYIEAAGSVVVTHNMATDYPQSRSAYLARRLDYYPYYEVLNERLSPTDRVWPIHMRRDSYHIDRPYFSDFVFEDYTLAQYVRDARQAADVLARARAAGITHLLVRHDVLLDYATSPIVDDRQPREKNLAKLDLLAWFFGEGTRLLRGDRKFWLIELPRENRPS